MRSFHCDLYWPRVNMYWENSGFGLGGCFNIGGASINVEGITCICMYTSVYMII